MSRCTCADRKPCPIHKDNPIVFPEVCEVQMFVIRVHEKWNGGDKRWFTTVTTDSIRVFESEHHNLKHTAIAAAADFITKP